MDEFIYNLLLKSTQGLTLLGTLRFRFTDASADTRVADPSALMKEALQRQTVELFVLQVEGTLSVPLITGAQPVPLSGLAFAGIAGVLTVLFSSADESRGVGMQIIPLDATHVGGGLNWQPGDPANLVFSVLGTQIPFSM